MPLWAKIRRSAACAVRPVADAEIGLDHDRHGCPTTLACFSRFGLLQYCFPPYHPKPPARLISVWTACNTSDLQRVTRKNKCCPCRGSKIKPGWFREASVGCSAELAEPRLLAGNDRSLGLVSRHTAVVRLCTSARRSRAAVLCQEKLWSDKDTVKQVRAWRLVTL